MSASATAATFRRPHPHDLWAPIREASLAGLLALGACWGLAELALGLGL